MESEHSGGRVQKGLLRTRESEQRGGRVKRGCFTHGSRKTAATVSKRGCFAHGSRNIAAAVSKRGCFAHGRRQKRQAGCRKARFAHGVQKGLLSTREIGIRGGRMHAGPRLTFPGPNRGFCLHTTPEAGNLVGNKELRLPSGCRRESIPGGRRRGLCSASRPRSRGV